MPGALQREAHCNRFKTGLLICADDSKRDRTFPAWLRGMGLPDDGQDNTTVINLLTGSPSRRDPHYGLLLNKNGPSADCSAAGARIRGVEGMPAAAIFPLGFDIRNGTHCGAGAPRFNLSFRTGSTPGF